jgi:ornithine cyclodeaminase/alanine dehydrogenase-like protein (mu-crystallin family)
MQSVSEQQVRASLCVDDVIAALRLAFGRGFSSTVRMPVRTMLELAEGTLLLLMPCYDTEVGAAGVKTVTVNARSGVQATYDLIEPDSGAILARMAANYLTDLRTAATSALATDLLARADAETLGVFGCGRQAITHLNTLPRVRPFRRFLVCGSTRDRTESFCARMNQYHGINVAAVDADTCAAESDVICTCTSSPTPVFDGRRLRPGTHLNLVGAFQQETREVDDETVRQARIVVDTYEGALAEAGDLLIPLKNGTIGRDQIVADLHEIASGKRRGRISREDITLFKSVGCAIEDLVTAKLVYEKAVRSI